MTFRPFLSGAIVRSLYSGNWLRRHIRCPFLTVIPTAVPGYGVELRSLPQLKKRTPSCPPPPFEEEDLELPPPPTDCCMSGCVNCVWVLYAEELAQIYQDGGEAAEKVLEAVEDPSLKIFLSLELREKFKS